MVKRFLFFRRVGVDCDAGSGCHDGREVRAVFDKYIAIQNAHDLKSMRSLLADTPDFL